MRWIRMVDPYAWLIVIPIAGGTGVACGLGTAASQSFDTGSALMGAAVVIGFSGLLLAWAYATHHR